LQAVWQPGYAAMLLELAQLLKSEPGGFGPREHLFAFLERQTGQRFGPDLARWHRWMWTLPYHPHPRYSEFKGYVYGNIDPRMQQFFPPDRPTPSRIRLDQVQWGGVRVNGIPPLTTPATLAANEAAYLKDSHIVFGIALNGEARAYPKRILAWHEMANDTIGGVALCIFYCTLCGTVIPYRTGAHAFGTSGLLYESSKLMFDAATYSLWSTLLGEPVIGPLAESGQKLDFVHVTTTTWGEWRQENPQTRVLSLATGHQRNYNEGAAYRAYFATQDLMFEVSRRDARLKNKDEVLIIRLPGKVPVALAVKRLSHLAEFRFEHEGATIIVRHANTVTVNGQPFPAHRAFWFGWHAQFPTTRLLP